MIGYGMPNSEGRQNCYPCMTMENMGQAVEKAKKDGYPIEGWGSQTVLGEKMAKKTPPKVVKCEICLGSGCPVCEWSGWLASMKRASKWASWQIESMKKDYRKPTL